MLIGHDVGSLVIIACAIRLVGEMSLFHHPKGAAIGVRVGCLARTGCERTRKDTG